MLIGLGLLTGTNTPPPARNTNPLSQIAGVQANFDLDATLSSSYSGSGTNWANMIAAPDDGTAQAGYDFTLESSPTFTGSANDAAAYWAMGGANYFQLASGTNTATLKNLHKTTGGVPFTAIIAIETQSNVGAIEGNLMGTAATTGAGDGWCARLQATSALRSIQLVGGITKSTNLSTTYGASTNYLSAIAVDYTASTIKFANNARSFTAGTLTTGADTTDPINPFQIGSAETIGIMPAGTKIYGCYLFNKLLSDADLSNVVTVLNSRHNRTYA